jgi:hypothetical protein
VAIQAALALPIMIWAVPRWPIWVAVLALSHLLLDDSKIRLGRRGWAEVAAFFADQAIHIVILWAIVQVSGARAVLSASTETIVRIAIALVAGAYAGAIVVLLVGNAMKGGGGPTPIPPGEFRRGIAERSAVVLTALALAAAGLPAIVSIGLAAAYLVLARWLRRLERQRWVRTVVSVAWALIVSLWTVA